MDNYLLSLLTPVKNKTLTTHHGTGHIAIWLTREIAFRKWGAALLHDM